MDITSLHIHPIKANWLSKNNLLLDVLRLDKVHPVISGNKWFKLKYYLEEAINVKKEIVATFGGAWSNHIVATACACHEAGLKSVGIIRGERLPVLSDTLLKAEKYGMKLYFETRENYRDKERIKLKHQAENWYWINEGGYGIPGAKGAAEILQLVNTKSYTHIIAAAGTGTMLAGLLLSANKNQKIIGISSMKGNLSLYENILKLTAGTFSTATLEVIHDYHFGGYAKHPKELIDFINAAYLQHGLPLDIIYTGKTFYAIQSLAEKGFFETNSRMLMIHSGGLQGNKSLTGNELAF